MKQSNCHLTSISDFKYLSNFNFRAEKDVGMMESAHDGMVWSLAWHPLGHILCSGSNDHSRYFRVILHYIFSIDIECYSLLLRNEGIPVLLFMERIILSMTMNLSLLWYIVIENKVYFNTFQQILDSQPAWW